MSEEFSKIYLDEDNETIAYRYNYEYQEVEYLELDEDGEWDMVDSYGLELSDWEDDPEYCLELLKDKIGEENEILFTMEDDELVSFTDDFEY